MAGFDNDVMYADNVDFSGGTPVSAKITSNGQLLIGSTASPNIRVGTPTNGNNIQWTLGSGSITAAVVGPPSPTTLTNHGVVIGQGTSALVATATGSTGQVLQSGGASADPSYSTPTYPSASGSVGTILRSDGTNNVYTTATYPATATVSQLLYGSASNVISGLSTANNGTLVTSNTGVPSILAGPGTTGNILQSNAAAAPSFSTATYPSVATGTGTILRADGTNWVATTATYPATTTVSQILYSSATNVVSGLSTANNGALVTSATGVPSVLAGPGTTGNILQSNAAAAPSFSTATYPSVATGTGTILRANGTNWVATTATYPTTTTANQILYSSATNTVSEITGANNGVLITSNAGVPSLLANGTAGQVLTANTGAPPSWQSNPALAMQVVVQRKTATGAFTYTPTSGMLYVIVELVGGGGGSGGVAATAGQVAFSGSGGGGGYARFLLSAAQVGASLTGSVGIAGTAGTAGNNAGGAGGDTTLATAAAWTCPGGSGGAGSGAGTGGQQAGANGGVVTTGTGTILHVSNGNQGGYSGGTAATFVLSGMGGSSLLGIGGPANVVATLNTVGNSTSGAGFGSGASSTTAFGTNSATAGAVGTQGVAIFTEFL